MLNNHQSRLVIFLACLLLSLAVAKADGLMSVFTPPEGRFSVYMEGKPIIKSMGLSGISSGKCYGHDEKEGGYWVTWADVPLGSADSVDAINRGLNGACNGAVVGMNAKESARYSVNLQGGYPGRQVEGALPNSQGFFRMRMFLVGNRLYQLVVVGHKAYLAEGNPNKFLNSLTITQPGARPSTTMNLSASQKSSGEMDRQRKDMQRRSNALKQQVQEQQNRVRKDLEAARARRDDGVPFR